MNSIRKFRKEKGITQRELSQATGINVSLISRYESGAVSPPMKRLTAIAKALDVSIDELTDDFVKIVKRRSMQTHLCHTLIQSSNGHCELCNAEAPFFTEDGRPYLELHHVLPLKAGGTDTLSNTVVLCPNCHRKVHVLNNEQDIAKLQAVTNKRNK